MKGNFWGEGAGEVVFPYLDAHYAGVLNYIKVCKVSVKCTLTKYVFIEVHMTLH